jgi:hypothetical protein
MGGGGGGRGVTKQYSYNVVIRVFRFMPTFRKKYNRKPKYVILYSYLVKLIFCSENKIHYFNITETMKLF